MVNTPSAPAPFERSMIAAYRKTLLVLYKERLALVVLGCASKELWNISVLTLTQSC